MPRKQKAHNFRTSLAKGASGVMLAKMVLRSKFPVIEDFDKDMRMQKRGIDLYVENLGYLEVKTDFHDTANFFVEVSVGVKPGTLDRSCADYLCCIFPTQRIMYILPRAYVVKYLRDKWAWLKRKKKVREITSYQGRNTWTAKGVIIDKQQLIRAIRRMKGKVLEITWEESEEVLARSQWVEVNSD